MVARVTHVRVKPEDIDESVRLFDVYQGTGVPQGQKSLAYGFIYRSGERNLTDTEVNAAHEKLVEKLKAALNATVRE